MVPICSLDLYVTYRLFHLLNNITCQTSVTCTYIEVTHVFKQSCHLIALAEKEEYFHE